MDPTLSERDARLLADKITERLRALGGSAIPPVFRIGVALERGCMWFTVDLFGRMVTVRRGEGNFRYDDIARELWLLAREPTDRGLEILSIKPPEGVTAS